MRKTSGRKSLLPARLASAVATCLLLVACGSEGRDDGPTLDPVPAVDVASTMLTVVGRNCRAEQLDASGTAYRSTYFDVMSDGSERVTTEGQTEVPCP